MNWKLIIIGGIVFWLVINVCGFVTGMVIHERVLDPIYKANAPFWLPELAQDPPDMAALMPQWLAMSFLSSLVVSGIYSCVRGSFGGPGWKKGMMWGLSIGIFTAVVYLNMGGIFNLPMKMWIWWGVDAIVLSLIGGAAMGWAAERFGGSG